ncbi:MAG: hypothetical protein F9K29_03665 [Hyphomicrobiaceae bacterium]|nr:MAG: hypothetical protein F9K29_03665 [Hyphomicrobiaceae bacterium]
MKHSKTIAKKARKARPAKQHTTEQATLAAAAETVAAATLAPGAATLTMYIGPIMLKIEMAAN